MVKKQFKMLVGVSAALFLAACAAQNDDPGTQDNNTGASLESPFPLTVEHEGTPIENGVLRYALVSASPIPGVLNAVHYDTGLDGEIMTFISENILGRNANHDYDQSGMAEWQFDKETKILTVKLKSADYKWSDGQPLTIEDYIYAFEVIGHKDYTGLRYDETMHSIVGMEAYHRGEAETITGITKIDDQTATFQFSEITSSIFRAGGLWSAAIPKHSLSKYSVAEQPATDEVRKAPVGNGPFMVTSVVEGESVTLAANPYYWRGQAKVSGAVIDVVSPSTIADEMALGNYDLTSMPNTSYTQFKDLQNVTLLGKWTNIYSYLSFKLGKRDSAMDTNVMDPNAKMADKSLRQAMGYAIDNELVGTQFYHGLRRQANSLIVPYFTSLYNPEYVGYTYDEEKANKLLDDAGYKDVTGDGIREDKAGQPLTINFAMPSGDEVAEALAQYYIQAWKKVGLNVQLTDGRLQELKTFYDRVEADDPAIDVYQAAWSTGADPYPSAWAPDTIKNYSRYNTEAHTELLKKLNSEEAIDIDKAKALYQEWHQFTIEEAFAIPTLYRTAVTVVNKRVKYYDVTTGTKFGLHELELTSDKGVAN